MRFFPKEVWWHYACLLIVLFALAALAVWHTLDFIAQHLKGPNFTNAAVQVWLISLGFMLITGAFGLWAIRFSSEVESLKKVGMLVDSMDYLSDGLLVLDKKGRVTGSNPAIRNILGEDIGGRKHLHDIFTCLSNDNSNLLLETATPQEIERTSQDNGISRTLRFRSQPSAGFTLVMVSDVTLMNSQHLHRRQTAQLQLIGHIARGVAHDFNNLLCVISGHASLLKRLPHDSPEFPKSVASIITSTSRGTALAGQLLELAGQRTSGQPSNMCHEYVKNAIITLNDIIAPGWQITSNIEPLPTISLTGIQIEQVVLNLALIATDSVAVPGLLTIITRRPAKEDLADDQRHFAGLITISAEPSPELYSDATVNNKAFKSGVILSVVRSLLEEAGCALEFSNDEKNKLIFRVMLPHGSIAAGTTDPREFSKELESYISDWTVLLAIPGTQKTPVETRLEGIGVKIIRENNITSTLAHIEETGNLDAIIIDQVLLGREMRGLLKAILKLRPSAGIVLTGEDPSSMPEELAINIVYAEAGANPDKTLLGMIEARNQALRRKQKPSA